MAGTLNTTTTQTLAVTTSLMRQYGTTLQTTDAINNWITGSGISNITILPKLKSMTLKFSARGLKPNTRLYAYFNSVPVSNWCAPVAKDYDNTSIESQKNAPLLGSIPLYSDADGMIYGIFRIPEASDTFPGFQTGECTFLLTDISNLEQGQSARTTQAECIFHGNRLQTTTTTYTANTRSTTLSSSDTHQDATLYGLAVENNVTYNYVPDPPPQTGGSGCGCGSIICTKLYELGLMDHDTYEADQQFGEYLRQSENADIYWGYIRWASIVVNWMSGNTPNVMFWIRDPEKRRARELDLTLKITHRIATPWAEHMQFLMGRRETDNKVGKLIMSVGVPISKLINKLPKFNNQNPSWLTKCSMIGLFVVLYNISKVFGGKFGFPEPLNT